MMAAMGMAVGHPWTAIDFFFTFAMWTVMMVGMMTGSAAPMLLLFAATRKGRGDHAVDPTVLTFGLGYFTVWAGFSALAAIAQGALQRAALMSPAMSTSSAWLTAAILIIAGAYQLTPLKGSCLTECRSPLGFLMTHWRDGNLGAYRMGTAHGLSCLGCCWALMCVLFAVGIMNLAWVAVLTALVLIEKVSAGGVVVSRAAGAAMIVAGVYLLTRT
jgi:predicted metal-binding membrane protein